MDLKSDPILQYKNKVFDRNMAKQLLQRNRLPFALPKSTHELHLVARLVTAGEAIAPNSNIGKLESDALPAARCHGYRKFTKVVMKHQK